MVRTSTHHYSPQKLRALAGWIMVVACLAGAASAAPDDMKRELTAAVSSVRPALVRIHVVATDYRQGRELKLESFGSGVIISPDGYAVTNHHVAMDAEHIVCTLADKREVDAKLVGTDPLADIAVIRLESAKGEKFPFASFGDSSKLDVGDRVYAMGCPMALSQSVTSGMVSNIEMVMPAYFFRRGVMLEGEDVGSIVRWIGHDALIRSGNSGGPLVNRDGEIVGINELSFGLSGAIPSNLVREVADQIIKDGKVTRSWLGMEVQPLLESSGLDSGILISGVLEDSPASGAGLQSGDVLLSLAGHETSARFQEEIPIFNQFVAGLPVGEALEAKVLRDGKQITISVTTAEREKAADKEHELRNWGICGTNITYLMEKEMQLDSQDGVVVTGILPSGPSGSAKPSLVRRDVILKVSDQRIKDVGHLRALTKELTEGHDDPVPVVVSVLRKQKQLATVVKVGKKEPSKPGAEISKAWLAIDLQVLTRELAEALGAAGSTGVRVTQVHPGSSAESAGLEVGDLIVKLDGDDIPADQIGDEEVLPSLIRQYRIGAEVTLGIIRAGKQMDVVVKLETSPKPTRDYVKYEDDSFEFTARDIAFSDRADGSVDRDQSGAYVQSVAEGSWAALGELRTGDVVIAIDGATVSGLDDLKRTMSEIAAKKPKAVVFSVRRGIHTLFLEFEPFWPESGP